MSAATVTRLTPDERLVLAARVNRAASVMVALGTIRPTARRAAEHDLYLRLAGGDLEATALVNRLLATPNLPRTGSPRGARP